MAIDRVEPVAVVGGGPAGLMAAEVLAEAGMQVDVFDAMPSVGRKFLLAGKGGLNLTHSEPFDAFVARYGARRAQIEPLLRVFTPHALRAEEINPAAAEEALEKAKGLAVTPEEQITLLKAQQRARAQLAVARRAKENLH